MTTEHQQIHDKLKDMAFSLPFCPESALKRGVLWRACDLIADYCLWHRMTDSEPEWGKPVLARYTDDGGDGLPEITWSDARDGSWGDRVPLYWLFIPSLTLTQTQTK